MALRLYQVTVKPKWRTKKIIYLLYK